MAEASDLIRQDIESTREMLDEKLEVLQEKARETVDIRHHVAERPWTALGAAVLTGVVVGSLIGGHEGGESSAAEERDERAPRHPGWSSVMRQFSDELDLLRDAAVMSLIGLVRQALRTQAPALSRHLDRMADERGMAMPNGNTGHNGHSSERDPGWTGTRGTGGAPRPQFGA